MPLGWIDFSKTERSKTLSVLDMLSESGTLDELGIAPIRDGFANLFFPGTTTIQTRAKYFFAVPYALKDMERSIEVNPNRITNALNELEKRCGELFLSQDASESGIIGKRALTQGKWVKRTPADIYWAGLRQYGIFKAGNLSISEYIRAMCVLKNQKTTLKKLGNRNDAAEENEYDDSNAGDIFKMQFWKMPLYTEGWFDVLTMKLTREEGAFLKQQIITSFPSSMMAYILKNNMTEILNVETYQELKTIIQNFPKEIQRDYSLALCFSNFIYAVRTIYNIVVSDGKNYDANIELERLKPDFEDLAAVDLVFIMDKFNVFNNSGLRVFLTQAQELMKIADIEGLKKCIKNREIFLKGANRAKTSHPGEFDPTVWLGGGELDYRFNNAKMIIRDIFESEVDVHA